MSEKRLAFGIHRRVRALAAVAADAPGLAAAVELLTRTREDVLTVLTYHRVDEIDAAPDLDPALLSATPDGFRRQIEHLARSCHVVSLPELIAARRGETRLPPGSVMITFDDAYEDFKANAWPVLRRTGTPVTLFVPTAYPDRGGPGFWWDRLHRAFRRTARRSLMPTCAGELSLASTSDRARSFARLRDHLKGLPHAAAMEAVEVAVSGLDVPDGESSVLGWNHLRALARDGVTLAPHSRTHPILSRLPIDRARDELVGSFEDLAREVGPPPRVLAYPAGGYSSEVVALVQESGFEIAFTTERGRNDLRHCSWLELARCNVGHRSSLGAIRLQLRAPVRPVGRRHR
jgi:peptidoglycan/xylan/chitin deacetylase (PgdA/CDA1 family)